MTTYDDLLLENYKRILEFCEFFFDKETGIEYRQLPLVDLPDDSKTLSCGERFKYKNFKFEKARSHKD